MIWYVRFLARDCAACSLVRSGPRPQGRGRGEQNGRNRARRSAQEKAALYPEPGPFRRNSWLAWERLFLALISAMAIIRMIES